MSSTGPVTTCFSVLATLQREPASGEARQTGDQRGDGQGVGAVVVGYDAGLGRRVLAGLLVGRLGLLVSGLVGSVVTVLGGRRDQLDPGGRVLGLLLGALGRELDPAGQPLGAGWTTGK